MVIGLTGNIGSGKTTVAELLSQRGLEVIDADILGKEVADKSQKFQNWLHNRFGDNIFENGILNRAALGKIVFSAPDARDDLNREIWPYIKGLLEERIAECLKNGKIPLVDAAMIFEWGDEDRYDLLISVIVAPEIGAKRAAERMGLSYEEMLNRYKMQIPAKIKAERSDIVIYNEKDITNLKAQISEIWERNILPLIKK